MHLRHLTQLNSMTFYSKVGYEVKGDLTIELVEKPIYLTDMFENAPKAFDTIEFDDLLFKSGQVRKR